MAAIGVLTGAFVLLGDLALVAGLANLLLLVVFVLVNAALIKLRVDHPVPETGFRVPLAVGRIPVTAVGGLVSCLALAVFSVLDGL